MVESLARSLNASCECVRNAEGCLAIIDQAWEFADYHEAAVFLAAAGDQTA